MADIFISYAREDHARASAIAASLRQRGWDVWWDEQISPGTRFRNIIARELSKASCVVVLWSKTSIAKDWVLEEAGEGKDKLVPALIDDGISPPLGFKSVQAAKLDDWTPSSAHVGFDALVASISLLVPPTERVLDEGAWRRLMEMVQDGLVVPVVGHQLLQQPGSRGSMMRPVAQALLAGYGLNHESEPKPFRELADAVALLRTHLRTRGESRQYLHAKLHKQLQVLERDPKTTNPVALRQLAEITDFRIFVTTTADRFLERCLRERGSVETFVHALLGPSSDIKDLDHGWHGGGSVRLLYLFGRSQMSPIFAIDDDEVEGYVDNINRGGFAVPLRILYEARSLVFIGCGYPPSLMRAIARALGGRGLSGVSDAAWAQIADGVGAFVVHGGRGVDDSMVWRGPPEAFVAELHQRWQTEAAAAGQGGTSA